MTIAIISTIRESWGGSEELWAACVTEAINDGHQAIISMYDEGHISFKTQILVNKGARLDFRIGSIPEKRSFRKYFVQRVKRVYYKTLGNPFKNLFKHRPDIVLYVGTAYSIGQDYKLLKLVNKFAPFFFINVQLNCEYDSYKLSPRNKKRVVNAYRLARGVLFVSERNKQVAEKHLQYKIEQGLVVRNPVNMKEKGIVLFPQYGHVHMALVGNLATVHKGQDIVLSALARPEWQERHWHLNIYGSGPDEQYLMSLCTFYGLQDRVTFHGRVDDIRALWAQNHVLLMPSLMEGMPLAVVEAMLCGRPCVVTDVGGHKELITEAEEGFIAEAPSVDAFAKAMERAWRAIDQWEEMGVAAHKKALSLYDPYPGRTLLHLLLRTDKH